MVNFLCFVTVLSSFASFARFPCKEELQNDSAHDPFPCSAQDCQEPYLDTKLKKMCRDPGKNKKLYGTCILYIHVSFLLVTLSNDIQTQPGPRTPKYPCGSCSNVVSNNQNSIQCDG